MPNARPLIYAKIAYNAYRVQANSQFLPPFEDLQPESRDCWMAAANAVLSAATITLESLGYH